MLHLISCRKQGTHPGHAGFIVLYALQCGWVNAGETTRHELGKFMMELTRLWHGDIMHDGWLPGVETARLLAPSLFFER